MSPDAAVALAGRVGAHAWIGFPVLLVLATALAGGLAASSRAPARPEPAAQDAPRIGRRLLGGFAAIVLCAAVFALLASLLGDTRLLQRCDEALSQATGRYTPGAMVAVLAVLTHLGEPLLLWALGAGVALALALRGHRGLALVWLAGLLGNGVLNRLLKEIFVRARPLIDGLPGPASGFSFPSGHSSASLVAYTLLAWIGWRLLAPRWRPLLAMAATAVVLTTGASRVFLQVHYATDVLAGWCSGLAWTLVCVTSAAHWSRTRRAAAPAVPQ